MTKFSLAEWWWKATRVRGWAGAFIATVAFAVAMLGVSVVRGLGWSTLAQALMFWGLALVVALAGGTIATVVRSCGENGRRRD
jgi:hypothetical protein